MATKTITFRYKFDRLTKDFVAWLGVISGGLGCTGIVALILSTVPAWITHVVHCIQNKEWLFLIAGALAVPVAVIHGWGIWFGWWG